MPFLEQLYARPTHYFSISHFLIGFEKCDRLHGHNYSLKVQITYRSDDLMRTIDFRLVNSWIREIIGLFNQKTLLPGNSTMIEIQSITNPKNWVVSLEGKQYSFPQKDVIIIEDIDQTTTENLAIYIHKLLREKIISNKLEDLISQLTVMLSETNGNEVLYTTEM